MGKRKSSAKPPPKKAAPKLDVAFNCPFCNGARTVSCTMDWEASKGTVRCAVCSEEFTADINHLSEPVDLFAEWMDALEEAN